MRYVVCICILFTSVSLQAQRSEIPRNSSGSTGGLFDAKTAYSPNDSTKTKFFTIFKGNPGRAALYSLVLPGAGQLYNKRWWKVPLVYGLEGAAIYFHIRARNDFTRFNTCYESLSIDNIAVPECSTLTTVRDAFRVRNSARSNKELTFLMVIGAHLFQTLEAFIDRHLIDFDVDDNLTSMPSPPPPLQHQLTLFSFKIPLYTR